MLFALFAGATAVGVIAAGHDADARDATQQQILAELKAARDKAENEQFYRERGLPLPTWSLHDRLDHKFSSDSWPPRHDPPVAAVVEAEMSDEDDLTKDPRFQDAPE
jgi:hypothetical protein